MKIPVLVTGVGGGVGQSIIKSLQSTDYRVVGVDSEELATGLYAVKSGYKGHYANSRFFISRLLEICKIEKCRLLFVGHDIELKAIAENIDLFKSIGTIPIVSSTKAIEISDDKLSTCEFLKSNGFIVPETHQFHKTDINSIIFPVILKPQRGGARSRKTYIANSINEFKIFSQLIDKDNCVVQEYIEGDEFTCGSITFDGKCRGVIAMRRTLRDGDTYKAFVDQDPNVINTVQRAVEALKPLGPCNIQLRLRTGIPIIFEINARCSGTTGARTLAGFNEPKMTADFLLTNLEPIFSIREITILRYWQEIVIANSHINELRQLGHIEGSMITL